MRSRTELVTTQLEGSEFEDESDFEDSEEDWKPAKGEQVSNLLTSDDNIKTWDSECDFRNQRK